jgi:hypothetical protein
MPFVGSFRRFDRNGLHDANDMRKVRDLRRIDVSKTSDSTMTCIPAFANLLALRPSGHGMGAYAPAAGDRRKESIFVIG